MNHPLNSTALMAWNAFETQNYSVLEMYGNEIYNYFVHNPNEILKLDNPLLIGKVFQACLGFKERDEDIQEVRPENAFLCFSQAIKSDKPNIHDEACARIMLLLIRDQKHLISQVEKACQKKPVNPYDFFDMLDDGLPNDMPMATNTKMLFTAYYLYNSIISKENISTEFINPIEKNAFESVKSHILYYCSKLMATSSSRKIALGNIVFDKINQKLKQDIENYSKHIR